jgi:predicted N-formylglutamate amidohydrolase
MKLVLTCEHGGNVVPKEYVSLFKNNTAVLKTHRSFDLGAFDVFNALKTLSNFSKSNIISRLLIELNRSLHHKHLFSEFSKNLSITEKQQLINQYYLPYRNDIENMIKSYIEHGETVLHLSVHSFTPILNNVQRNCDIGLLYDSTNKIEKQFCKQLKDSIKKLNPDLNVRYNYPYLGKADGFTTYLRKRFPENYLGIELEINQKFSKNNKLDLLIKQTLYKSLNQMIS